MKNGEKINAQIIFQEHEVDATYRAIESLLAQTGNHDITISVLLNGETRPDIRKTLSNFDSVKYHEAGSNRGVAGGRNILLRTVEADASDYIFFIDNDAIVTTDYVSTMIAFFRGHSEVGVAGAVSLKYKELEKHLDEISTPFTGYLGAAVWAVQNSQVAHFLKYSGHPKLFDHIGTNKDWRDAYLLDTGLKDTLLGYFSSDNERQFIVSNAGDKELAESILRGQADCIEVANIPGCCQAFRRELLDEIGILNELYNFYGFEDADFAVRAIKAGYTNYVVNGCYMFHGTDTRHAQRKTPTGLQWKRSNESRARTIFEYLHAPEDFPMVSFRRLAGRAMMAGHWSDMNGYEVDRSDEVYFAGVGFQQAVAQLRAEFGDEFDEVVSRGCERHKINLGGEPLAAIPQLGRDSELRDERPIADLTQRALDKAVEQGRNSALRALEPLEMAVDGSFDFSKLARFKDIHAGERCFIIGNGPSLNKTDFSLLKDEVTFGVNGLFYMTDDVGFTPTYYTVEDNHVVYDNLERIKTVGSRAKFFPEKYQQVLGDNEDTFYLPVDWFFYFKSHKFFETPRFSNDISKEIFVGQTVTYLNMQLAFYMGFTEVYLVGLDFSYEIPQNHPVDGFTITSMDDDPNHFHPAYFGKGKKWHFPKLHNCLKSYEYADEHYRQHDRTIYNATYGGKLECYERVDYSSLFEDFLQLEKPNDRYTWRVHQFLKTMERTSVEVFTLGLPSHRHTDVGRLVEQFIGQETNEIEKGAALPDLSDNKIVFADLAAIEPAALEQLFEADALFLANASNESATEDTWRMLSQALPLIVQRCPRNRMIWWHNDVLVSCSRDMVFESKLDLNATVTGRAVQTDMLMLARDPGMIKADRLTFSPMHVDQSGDWTELNLGAIAALIEHHVPFVLAPEGIFA